MSAVLPDILLLALGMLLMVMDVAVRVSPFKTRDALFHTAWLGLAVVFASTFFLPENLPIVVGDLYRVDGFGVYLRRIFSASALFALVLARPYFKTGADGQRAMSHASEFSYIIAFCTLGMFVLVSAEDLLTLFLGLELATVPLYVLAGFNKRNPVSAEAGVKYIMTGSMSTAFMLFCFSYFYGMSGTIRLDALGAYTEANAGNPFLWLGVLFMLGGSGFKLAAVPFHMWAPDVYAGSPTPATAFLSVSSKAAAVAFLLIMLYGPLAALHANMTNLMLALSGATMVVGNLGAMRQRNIRRFIAYSSITQAGYILLAFTGPEAIAKLSAVYYLLIYGAGNYAFFYIVAVVGEKRGENMESLRGLAKESPALAGMLAVAMFSLAGIPPVAGFTGKFMLFAAAAESGHYYFIIFAALNSTVSLYYYLLVIREAYINKPEENVVREPLAFRRSQRLALAVLTALTILLGLLPQISTDIQERLAKPAPALASAVVGSE